MALFSATMAAASRAQIVAEDEPSGPTLAAASRRMEGGQVVFSRPYAEAFVDPDERMSLLPRYYFPLAEGSVAAVSSEPEAPLAGPPEAQGRWLDSDTALRRRIVLMRREPDGLARLSVAVAVPGAEGRQPLESAAERAIPEAAVPLTFDAVDSPAPSAPRGAFPIRVIGVLVRIDGRYAVDFHGATLGDAAHRRLWLTSADPAWGQPTAVEFREIAVRKPQGGARRVSVMAVAYPERVVAFDFPLALPPALDALRKLATAPGAGRLESGTPKLEVSKLLGEDLADEFERRLVDAVDR